MSRGVTPDVTRSPESHEDTGAPGRDPLMGEELACGFFHLLHWLFSFPNGFQSQDAPNQTEVPGSEVTNELGSRGRACAGLSGCAPSSPCYRMPTTLWIVVGTPGIEPKNWASPKLKTPPSAPTSQ
jgi:hypothetical protein